MATKATQQTLDISQGATANVAIAVARTLAGEAKNVGQLDRARSICAEATRRIWKDILGHRNIPIPPLPSGCSLVPLDDHAEAAADAIAQCVSGRQTGWISHIVGSFYTQMLPDEMRTRNGAHYTPPALAEFMVAKSIRAGIDPTTSRCIDPSAGAGAFLIPLVAAIAKAMHGADDAVIVQALKARVTGVEIDPFAAWLANVFIELSVIDHVAASRRRLGEIVKVGDGMLIPDKGTYHLVIGNPPFGKTRLTPELRERFDDSLFGHANLYGVFLHAAVDLCAPEGVIAYLTPTSYLGGQYFTKLRSLLAAKAPPFAFDLVAERKDVFSFVLQETAISFFRKDGTSEGAQAGLSTFTGQGVTASPLGCYPLPEDPSAPWLLPRNMDGVVLAGKLAGMTSRLSDWGYRIKTGPLVWNRHKNEILNARPGDSLPIIWAEAVRANKALSLDYERRSDKARISPARGNGWLITDTPCILLQRTTAKEQNRRLIAGVLDAGFLSGSPGGVVVENHLNLIMPMTATPAVPITVVAAFLNSSIADQVFRCISGSVAVSAYELESMPLPAPKTLAALAKAVKTGDSKKIEKQAAALYGAVR